MEVSGTVDVIGQGVVNVSVGDQVLGTPDYVGCASAGASDYAIMNHWTRVPSGLDLIEAASLPMAFETAFRSLDNLGVTERHLHRGRCTWRGRVDERWSEDAGRASPPSRGYARLFGAKIWEAVLVGVDTSGMIYTSSKSIS